MNQSTGSETDANIWRNPLASSMDNVSNRDILDGRVSSSENRIPESIQKELDKRRIGERYIKSSFNENLFMIILSLFQQHHKHCSKFAASQFI
jgi:hypothetical protein